MQGIKKRDNHFTGDKIALRANNLPEIFDRPIEVLDAYSGHGVIWEAVKYRTGRDIHVTKIDKRPDLSDFHLHGDNAKIMAGIDLSQYDIIDLDAYGVPDEQLEIVFRSNFRGMVFATVCTMMAAVIPDRIKKEMGIPKSTPKTMQSQIFADVFFGWLRNNGVKTARVRHKQRKWYFCFKWHGRTEGLPGQKSINETDEPEADYDSERVDIFAGPA